MSSSQHDYEMKLLLAGYADGELSSELVQTVESWLSHHPEAWETLEIQQLLSPKHEELWKGAPVPSEQAWDRCFQQIALATQPTSSPKRSWFGRRWTLGITLGMLTSTAAALLVYLGGLQKIHNAHDGSGFPRDISFLNGDSGDGSHLRFPIAQAEDIEIISMPGQAHTWLVVGQPAHEPIMLAKAEDIEFHDLLPNSVDLLPDFLPSPDQPHVAPMIWLPRNP